MDVKIVLGGAFACQLLAAVLALRLNGRYRQRSAWTLISAAAIVMAIRPLASLIILWNATAAELNDRYLWTESLATLLMGVLFLAGIALIEPLFQDLARADKLLRSEKSALEKTVASTEEEMNLAHDIQQALIPEQPPDIDGLDIAGSTKPARWTSGDYFDYFQLADGTLLAIVADVSGHGAGPALVMTETRAYVRAMAQTHSDPGEILTMVNRALSGDISFGQFVTIFAARINPESMALTYAAAGQHAYLLRADSARVTLESTSPPLGLTAEVQIPTCGPEQLSAGDVLLLVTDGLNETQNQADELWGMDAVLDVVGTQSPAKPERILSELFRHADDFAGAAGQKDDNTAVVIKVTQSGKSPVDQGRAGNGAATTGANREGSTSRGA